MSRIGQMAARGAFRSGNIRNAGSADAEITGTLSGTESTLFRVFPCIHAYFRVTGKKLLRSNRDARVKALRMEGKGLKPEFNAKPQSRKGGGHGSGGSAARCRENVLEGANATRSAFAKATADVVARGRIWRLPHDKTQ
jgi:hypothetical protein